MFRLRVLAGGIAIAATACSVLYSFDDFRDDGFATDGGVLADGRDPNGDRPDVESRAVPCAEGNGLCAPPAPTNWTGPFTLYEGAPEFAPACDSTEQTIQDAFADASAPPATCGCSCNAPTGTSCTVSLSFAKSDACGACKANEPFAPNNCKNLTWTKCTDGTDATHFRVNPTAVPDAGSCVPKAGTKSAATPKWNRVARSCPVESVVGGTCEGNDQCVVRPVSPLAESTVCIAYAGDIACPSGPYATRHVYHRDFDDTRDCACSCGSPNGVACIMSGLARTFTNCASPVAIAPNTCIDGTTVGVQYNSVSADGGSCAPKDTPSGGVGVKTPVTICCL